MNLELIPNDNPILHTTCEVFNPRKPNFDLTETIAQMFALMEEKHGMGLAAPQVGIKKRFFIMKIEGKEYVCINPSILSTSSDREVLSEACLSYPGQHVSVQRPTAAKVRYMTARGLSKQKNLRGIAARCFQHELDHLNGVTIA